MIEDMILAGLAQGTQKLYVQAVRRLTAHYHRSPDLLSEDEVRGYLGLTQHSCHQRQSSGLPGASNALQW